MAGFINRSRDENGLVSWATSLLMVFLGGLVVRGEYGPVIIDGPWSSLPSGAGPGLSLDSEWGALTLKPDLTRYAFVLSPDPAKALSANVVESLGVHNGRLYLGYGDGALNLGPVDIVAYDPLTGELIREMTNVPEEHFGFWHVSTTGRFYVAGADARESGPLGNFLVNDGLGWQKRRTIQDGVHVFQVVECEGRLFARASYPAPSPVNYPYILASDNQGASWSYERIDPGLIDLSLPPYTSTVNDIAAVTYRIQGRFARDSEYLYAIVSFRKPGGEEVQRLYRFDGQNWVHVRIDTPSGELKLGQILAVFKGQILVLGSAGRTMVYALDGQIQKEVSFLAGLRWYLGPSLSLGGPTEYPECDGWLYCIVGDPTPYFGSKVNPLRYILYRTQDLLNWETAGSFKPAPGVMPCSLGFAHGRLYVGAANMVQRYEQGYVQSRQCYVDTIHNSTLEWDADIPEGSKVTLKIRTWLMTTSSPLPLNNPWVGPDGTENTAFTTSGQVLNPQHNGDDVLQVAIYKMPNDNGEYPHVRSVTLNSPGGSVMLAMEEGAGLYTAVNSTDPNGAEYLSKVFELQYPIAGGSLFFDGAAPDKTCLRFRVRSGLTKDQTEKKPFVGPNGTSNTFYQSNGQPLWTGHNGDTCIQYRAVLISSNPTVAPFLRKVTLLTRTDAMDHFDIQPNGPSTWTAGELNSITVTSRVPAGTLIPIQGKASLSAVAVDSGEEVPVQPNEMTLVDGVGTVKVLLQRATPTRIYVALAGLRGCSPDIEVQPGKAAAIAVTSNLVEPLAHWSPVGQLGQPFTLSLRVLDRYRNTVRGYTGTVHGERWSWKAEAQILPSYTFHASDRGCHEFSNVTIEEAGEWNLVLHDETSPQIAGTLTVNIQ